MDEIFAICDVVTVLKDGQLVGTRPLSEMTPASLIAMMVGRELEDLFPERGQGEGAAALSVSGLRLHTDSQPFSFTVRKGEIVGFAGLEGQGQQKAVRALVGQFALSRAQRPGGRDYPASCAEGERGPSLAGAGRRFRAGGPQG